MTQHDKLTTQLEGLISAWTMEAKQREHIAEEHQSQYGATNDIVVSNRTRASMLRTCADELEHIVTKTCK